FGVLCHVTDDQTAIETLGRKVDDNAFDETRRSLGQPNDLTHPGRNMLIGAFVKAMNHIGTMRTVEEFLEVMAVQRAMKYPVELCTRQANTQAGTRAFDVEDEDIRQ